MHRQTIEKMCSVANVTYDKSGDPDAPDWFIWIDDVNTVAPWVPSWANGVNPESLYEWMLEQSETNFVIHQAMKDGGMRPRPLIRATAYLRGGKVR